MPEDRQKVFISYSSKDKAIVDKLAHDLLINGLYVWYDSWEILVGHDIIQGVYDGIRSSDYLALVITKNALKSKWVTEELNLAKLREIEEQRTIVLPLLFQPIEIPSVLKTKRYANFTGAYEKGLAELLTVFGIAKTDDDMVFQLAKALEQYSDPKIKAKWDIYSSAYNRYSLRYIPRNNKVNLEVFLQIKKKIDDAIKQSERSIRADHETLSLELDNEKGNNAFWRDTLEYKTEIIAREILKEKEKLFLDDLALFQEKVVKEFRWRVLNEIGPSLANLWTSRAGQVISHALNILYIILECEIGETKNTTSKSIRIKKSRK
ncbi:MAG: toll/interleukin-1 receptor domain-containing protein [Anaerolineales bacterium]|nr:toll/interleukin-1 receptor domain-containing protein [Anaerolineales bacterium]